eukprot:6190808-Pleurochrysis_carterae.AAC.2
MTAAATDYCWVEALCGGVWAYARAPFAVETSGSIPTALPFGSVCSSQWPFVRLSVYVWAWMSASFASACIPASGSGRCSPALSAGPCDTAPICPTSCPAYSLSASGPGYAIGIMGA